jgi:adenosylmethionine-8-amino-7-oxononanoate aminotransferase
VKKVNGEKKGGVFYRAPGKEYPMVERAKGVYIYDTDGKKYLDGASGCVVTNIGYGVTEVADAMRETAANISYVHSSTFTSQPQEELANCLAESAPAELNHIYFVSGGTEANETAMSMAIQYQLQRGHKNKFKIIGRTLSYHGSSFGTLSVASNIARRRMFSPLLLPFPLVPAPHCYRCPTDVLSPVRPPVRQSPGAGDPGRGPGKRGGLPVGNRHRHLRRGQRPPPGVFPLVREICDKYDVLFIADEVLCGYGRSGDFWLWNTGGGTGPL